MFSCFVEHLYLFKCIDVDNTKYLNYLNNSLFSEKLRIYHIHLQLNEFCILFFKIKALNVKHSGSLLVFITVISEKQ